MTTESTALTGEVLDQMPAHPIAVSVSPYITMMDRLLEKGGDLAQLDKLLDLNLRWEANEARKAYVADMAAFKLEPMVIGKNKRVSFKTDKGKTEYDHAELVDCTTVIVPNLAKHGFSHSWTVAQAANKEITVACVLTHRLGHSETVTMTAPPDTSGGKNTIQGIGSTKTYLERYTLLASVGMATGGQDDDGHGYSEQREPEPERVSEDQEATLRDTMVESGVNQGAFLAHIKVDKLSDLLAKNYEPAMKILRQKLAANEKAKTA